MVSLDSSSKETRDGGGLRGSLDSKTFGRSSHVLAGCPLWFGRTVRPLGQGYGWQRLMVVALPSPCRKAALRWCMLLQDGFGVELAEGFLCFQFCETTELLRKTKGYRFLSAPTQPQIHQVEDGSPKGGMWTSPANETAHKSCKGDIRPRGQWPKY